MAQTRIDTLKFQAWQKQHYQQPKSRLFKKTLLCLCPDQTGTSRFPNDADKNDLKKIIGNLIFGLPESKKEKEENSFTGFDEAQMLKIDKVYNNLMPKEDDSVEIAIINLLVMTGGEIEDYVKIPLFRVTVPRKSDCYNFVDLSGRWYKDFKDFVSNNNYPAGTYYVPKDDKYPMNGTDEVELVLKSTPAAKFGRRVLRATDIAGSVAGLVATIGLLLACPPAAVAWSLNVGSSLWGLGRASGRLHSLRIHKQGLASKEAVGEWIAVTGSVLGVLSSGAVAGHKSCASVPQGKTVSGPDFVKYVTSAAGFAMVGGTLPLLLSDQENPDTGGVFEVTLGRMLVTFAAEAGVTVVLFKILLLYFPIPPVIKKIESFLKKGYRSPEPMCRDLEEMLTKTPKHGLVMANIFKIASKFFDVSGLSQAVRLILLFKALIHFCYVATKYKKTSAEEAEIMTEVLSHDRLLPLLLTSLNCDEENFHFRCKSCTWDKRHVLSLEDYNLILQNFWKLRKGKDAYLPRDCIKLVDNAPSHFYVQGECLIYITLEKNQNKVNVKLISEEKVQLVSAGTRIESTTAWTALGDLLSALFKYQSPNQPNSVLCPLLLRSLWPERFAQTERASDVKPDGQN